MGKLTPEERPAMGQLANEVRNAIENLVADIRSIESKYNNKDKAYDSSDVVKIKYAKNYFKSKIRKF